ncbi:GNAT family N-acetyltransferase [Gallaecimonas kandeliae]|uniref:GNAT family N-acetyltransferase n=1 Tax=Gallaecimonas kandeliae TaxID=3029055 RepID=UPI0026491205|nr:GNAT family N-acetyltransferase [Gallaecimonas kandeliae]WKE67170.1 GNAT family N-acetyltransferase [Gallaecimonas kandeliae]
MSICSKRISVLHADLALAATLEAALPEFGGGRSVAQYRARFTGPHLCLVALVDGVPAAFKLGYALDDTTFYSWLGGVLPPYRRQGLAQLLLEAQEAWAAGQGYGRIEVKSSGRFPAMLALLARNGYQACGEHNGKILFAKPLSC